MNIEIVTRVPEIHSTPLGKIFIDDGSSIVEFDDINEKRWRISFKTILGWRITAYDCFDLDRAFCEEAVEHGRNHRYILEIKNSDWIAELRQEMQKRNQPAEIADKAHHYLMILGEEVVEVAAWDNYDAKSIG